MDWKSIGFLVIVFAFAAVVLYRAVRKKKWCPDVYGSGACSLERDTAAHKKKNPEPPERH
jgi:hypothetical protein